MEDCAHNKCIHKIYIAEIMSLVVMRTRRKWYEGENKFQNLCFSVFASYVIAANCIGCRQSIFFSPRCYYDVQVQSSCGRKKICLLCGREIKLDDYLMSPDYPVIAYQDTWWNKSRTANLTAIARCELDVLSFG